MVRSTPRRISFGPFSVSTDTCRSRISSVAMVVSISVFLLGSLVQGVLHVDKYVGTVEADRVDRHRVVRGQAQRLAGAQVEAGSVQPALDLAVADVTLGQLDLRVGTLVPHREVLSFALHDRDLDATDLHRDDSLVRYVGGGAGALKTVAHWPRTALAEALSSAVRASLVSITSCRCSTTSGTPILPMMSLKKPDTTSRRAASSGMPRACR